MSFTYLGSGDSPADVLKANFVTSQFAPRVEQPPQFPSALEKLHRLFAGAS
jgi:hypothetical protein